MSIDPKDIYDVIDLLLRHVAELEAGERQVRASIDRPDGRSVRKGHNRDTQINIKAATYVKARLTAYCARKGIAITDWLEKTVMSLDADSVNAAAEVTPAAAAVVEVMAEILEAGTARSKVPVVELYGAYVAACSAAKKRPVSAEAFPEAVTAICQKCNIELKNSDRHGVFLARVKLCQPARADSASG